jgi:putative salt-induced outer membrane protein YdiY
MRRFRNCGWLLLVWVAFLSVRAETVVLHLRSGDRLTGTIVSETTNQVTVLTAWNEKVTVPTSEIQKRESLPTPAPAPAAAPAKTLSSAAAPPPGAPQVVIDQKTREKLDQLLQLYEADQITPAQYHEQRAQLLGLATPPPAATPKAAAPPASAPAKPVQTAAAHPAPPAAKPAPPAKAAHPTEPASKKKPKPKGPKHWKVQAHLGATAIVNQSHTETYHADVQYDYAYKRFHQGFAYSTDYSRADGLTSVNRMYGSAKTDLHLGGKGKPYIYNSADALYDEIQRLDLLYHVGPGLGYELIQKPKFVLSPEAGATYTETRPIDAPATSSLSVRLAENATWHINQRTTLSETFEYFPQQAGFRDSQYHLTANLSHALSKLLSLNVGLDDWYYTAPSAGTTHNSLTVQSTLGISF